LAFARASKRVWSLGREAREALGLFGPAARGGVFWHMTLDTAEAAAAGHFVCSLFSGGSSHVDLQRARGTGLAGFPEHLGKPGIAAASCTDRCRATGGPTLRDIVGTAWRRRRSACSPKKSQFNALPFPGADHRRPKSWNALGLIEKGPPSACSGQLPGVALRPFGDTGVGKPPPNL